MLQVPQSTLEPELAKVTRRRIRYHHVVAAVAVVLLLLASAAGVIYWRATRAAITLDFIAGQVEAALKERLPSDARVSVGSTAFSYRSGEGVILRIRDLKLTLPGIATVVADELTTRSTASVIFGKKIDLQSVMVSGIDIGVSASAKLDREGNAADLVRRASLALMDRVRDADTIMRDTGLQKVVVHNATIHIDGGNGAGPPLKVSEANWLPLGAGRSKAWIQNPAGERPRLGPDA